MVFIKKYKTAIIFSLGVLALFLLTRHDLTTMPIFTDEAIYVRWAQIAKNDANWRFISLTDGKQPSFVWLAMISMRFIEDPLIASRLVSVFAGLASVIGLFFLGKELFKSTWVGLTSSFLYVLFPMALVYDRMALYDSLVSAFAIWALYLEVLLVRRLRLDIALILGSVMGGAVLTKTNGFFTMYLLPFSLLLFALGKKNGARFLRWLLLSILVVLITYAYYSILRLSPFFHIVDEKNTVFVYEFSEWIKHPFTFFFNNIKGLFDWFVTYLTVPVILLVAGSFFVRRELTLEKLLLLAWFLAPFTALALFGNNIYPRFIFFMVVMLLPLAALSLVSISQFVKKRALAYTIILLFLSLQVYSDFWILTDFAKAPIPQSDKAQYFTDWPSGAGVKESLAFFREEAKKGKIYVATQGTFGLMPYAYEMYPLPNVTLKGYWPIDPQPPQEVYDISKVMPTYFVFYQPCAACPEKGLAPTSWPATPVLQIKKIAGAAWLTVYKIEPK